MVPSTKSLLPKACHSVLRGTLGTVDLFKQKEKSNTQARLQTLLDTCSFSWLTVSTMLWSVSFMCPIKAVSLKPFSNTHNSHTFNLWITLKGL